MRRPSQYGRCDATSALLTAIGQLPKRWKLEAERELNEEAYGPHYDPRVDDDLDQLDEAPEELADLDLATELLTTPLPHDAEEDAQKTSNLALHPVPPGVAQALEAYAAHRQQAFNRHRTTGGAVEDITVSSDRANALRWLGFVKAEYAQTPHLKLFAHELVGEWTEAWVRKLRLLGCKGSTVAVYLTGVISVSAYALTLAEEPERCPTEELLTLRRQAEAVSKQEKLFATKSKHWLSWEDAQKARQRCVEKCNACTDRTQKQALLRDCLILAFHTLQPVRTHAHHPPRVAVATDARWPPPPLL